MNVYEYSLHAVGFLPGECDRPEGHAPTINLTTGRTRCEACGITGPLAHEWAPPIRRVVSVAAQLEAVS